MMIDVKFSITNPVKTHMHGVRHFCSLNTDFSLYRATHA